MNVFSLFLAEMAKLSAKKAVLISVIAALLVPVIYGAILLSPTWGPYDNLSNLPVAVVNNDKGAMSDNEQINVGRDLVEDLKKGNELGWEFVDSNAAKKGLDSLKYYMVIEIPEDFSKRVTTVLEPDPKKLELNYTQNEGLNFMAAQVTKSATEKIREKLANKVTEKYVTNIFSSLGDVSKGFKTAADGSAQLNDGTAQLHDGTSKLMKSLTEKSGDISKLAEGSNELEKGTGQLVSILTLKQKDITKLANGSKQLKDGTGLLLQSLNSKSKDISKLANGSKELESGTGQILSSLSSKQGDITNLANGSKELKNGTGLLLTSLNSKSSDIAKLATGANDVNNGTGLLLQSLKDKQPKIKELAAGGIQLEAGVSRLKNGTGALLQGLKDTQNGLTTRIQPGSQQVSIGVNQMAQQMDELSKNIAALSAGFQAYAQHPALAGDQNYQYLAQSIANLSAVLNSQESKDKLKLLIDGSALVAASLKENGIPNQVTLGDSMNQLIAGQTDIDNGVKVLNEKTPLLAAGNSEVEKGWGTLIESVSAVHSGTTLIADGNQSVKSGWNDLTAGVTKLDNGAGQIAGGNASIETGWRDLTNGVSRIHSGIQQVSAGNISVEKGWQSLTEGVTKLDSGAGQISVGNATVDKGWHDLTNGAAKIHSGMIKVSDGNSSVHKGWGDLTDGVTKLNDGASKLDDGSSKLASGLKDGAEKTSAIKADVKNIDMFASPVELKGDTVHKYPYYRDSTAPYVLSLALFVGILILSLFINFRRPEEVSALSWLGAKFLNLASIAIVQALLLSIVVMLFLNMDVQTSAGFILFAVVASIVFSAIVLFFASFGNIGRLVALALVVLQLSTTGANLPIDMLPANLRALSAFLPFTYSIAGFKSVITLNDFGAALENMGVLLIYLALFTALSFTVFLFKSKTQVQQTDLSM